MSDVIINVFCYFPKEITEDQVQTLANELAAGPDCDKYSDVRVRKESDTTFGIGFEYNLDRNDPKRGYDALFHRVESLSKSSLVTGEGGDKLYWIIGGSY